MDEFEKSSFSVSSWINKTLMPSETSSVQEQVAMTIKKLQLNIFEVSSVIEVTNQEIVESLPSLMEDVHRIQEKMSEIKKELKSVSLEFSKEEKNPAEDLIRLERNRQRLDATVKALKDADSWSTVVDDIDALYEAGDLNTISARISKLAASVGLWNQSPDHKQKLEVLENLRNRLEAEVGPKLLTALHENDLEKIKSTISMMSSIGRVRQACIYITQHRRGTLHQKWKEAALLAGESGKLDWYQKFWNSLATEWLQQNRWFDAVLSRDVDTQSISVELLSDVLVKLDPSPAKKIELALRDPSHKLAGLETIKNALDRFCGNVAAEGVVSRCSKDSDFREKVVRLTQAVYLPYVQLLSQYPSLEVETFPTVQFESEDCSDALREIKHTTKSIFAAFEKAMQRCQTLTGGRNLGDLTNAMISHLMTNLGAFQLLFDAINRRKQTDDFTNCDLCLRFVECLGDVLQHIAKLDTEITNHMRAVRDMPLPSCPLIQRDWILVGDDVRARIELILVSLKKGGSVLLDARKAYSGLNTEAQSAAFELIFKPIEKRLRTLPSADWRKEGGAVVEGLPAFSYAPQEYITQIGQYLMTLPQHFEVYTNVDHPGLLFALGIGALPYYQPIKSEESSHVTSELLLASLGLGLCEQYAEKILDLQKIGGAAKPQLLADIDYLGNIFEDLGLDLSPPLSDISRYLRSSSESLNQKLKENLDILFQD